MSRLEGGVGGVALTTWTWSGSGCGQGKAAMETGGWVAGAANPGGANRASAFTMSSTLTNCPGGAGGGDLAAAGAGKPLEVVAAVVAVAVAAVAAPTAMPCAPSATKMSSRREHMFSMRAQTSANAGGGGGGACWLLAADL